MKRNSLLLLFLHRVGDTDGNLIRDGLWTNIWNGENRLVRTESLSTVPEAARARVDWTHLPDGRWIERIVSTWVSGVYVPQSTNRFVWDGQVLLCILDEDNAGDLSFMRGLDVTDTMQGAGGAGGLLAVKDDSNSQTHFVGNDGNANVTLLVSASNTSESARYAYNPFGEELRASGDIAKRNPIRFSTQFSDARTGHSKYLFREYRPTIGKWLTKDPFDEYGGLNLYAMAANDTINWIDVLGLNVVPGSYSDSTAVMHSNLPPLPPGPPPPPSNSCGGTLRKTTDVALSWKIPATRNTRAHLVRKEATLSYDAICDQGGGGAKPQVVDLKWKSGNTTPMSQNGGAVNFSVGVVDLQVGAVLTYEIVDERADGCPKGVGAIASKTVRVMFIDKNTAGFSIPVKSVTVGGPSTSEKVIASDTATIIAECCCECSPSPSK